ncbi:hypothetical protein [Megasphaera cerevisiae]|jgi:hypothetical protein|nr:hypothetical protein [Megasphaera cerevisiae]
MIKPGIFSLYYTDDEKYILLPFFWLPEDTLELRCRRDHVLYDVWQKRGIHPDDGRERHPLWFHREVHRTPGGNVPHTGNRL